MSLVQLTEIWAQITQIAIGIWLLWRQLGATAVAPTLLAILCFAIQTQLSQKMGPSQASWVKAVGRRIGVTSSILRSMKSVKLAGLATSMGELLQAERVHELKMALKFRWLMVITQAFCMSHPQHSISSKANCHQQVCRRCCLLSWSLPHIRSKQRFEERHHFRLHKLSPLFQF